MPTVLVCRPQTAYQALFDAMTPLGWTVAPLLITDPRERSATLAKLPAALAKADRVIWVSPTAIDVSWPMVAGNLSPRLLLATVGKGSAAHLAALSQQTVWHPPTGYDSEAILASPEWQDLTGQRVLIIKGLGGRMLLADTLRQRGAQVNSLAIYERVYPPANWASLLSQATPVIGLVTASEAVEALFSQANDAQAVQLRQLPWLTIHAKIAQALHDKHVEQVTVCAQTDLISLVGALLALPMGKRYNKSS